MATPEEEAKRLTEIRRAMRNTLRQVEATCEPPPPGAQSFGSFAEDEPEIHQRFSNPPPEDQPDTRD